MDAVVRIQGQEFEWDTRKAQSNLLKHGVAFIEAAEVFFDPFVQFGDAMIEVSDEGRSYALGYTTTERLLVVVHVERGLRYRLISARKATREERKLYEST